MGGSAWYEHEYEYNYLESVILIILVILAIAFDHLWHLICHASADSYHYGSLHKKLADEQRQKIKLRHGHDDYGNGRHAPLLKELSDRAGSEFMTLGFLAFCTFMCNNLGLFKAMGKNIANLTLWPVPSSAEEWLHLVEAIHVKLFIGMMLYFILWIFVAKAASSRIRLWEQCRMQRLESLTILRYDTDKEYKMYLHWRDYFIENVMRWETKRPNFWGLMCQHLAIHPDNAGLVRSQVEERFAFSSYLAFGIEQAVADSINVHTATWFALLSLFAVFALLHRFAKIQLFYIVVVFQIVTVILLVVMWRIVGFFTQRIDRFMAELREEKAECDAGPVNTFVEGTSKLNQEVHVETFLIRSLQVMLFLVSYILARTLVDFEDWKNHTWSTLILVIILFVVFIVIILVLRRHLPTFLAVMTLPPFVDKVDLEYFILTMMDDHALDIHGQLLSKSQAQAMHGTLRQRSESQRLIDYSAQNAKQNSKEILVEHPNSNLRAPATVVADDSVHMLGDAVPAELPGSIQVEEMESGQREKR